MRVSMAGNVQWSYDECSDLARAEEHWMYDAAGRTLMLTPCDPSMAVVWGGTVSAMPTTGASSAFLPSDGASQLTPVPAGAAAGYAVFHGGQEIDASHPLAVTQAQAGQPIALIVVPVNASGEITPPVVGADGRAHLSDGGGKSSYPGGLGWAFITPSQPTAAVEYMNPHTRARTSSPPPLR